MTAALRLAEQLIARPSVTPDDAGCQALIAGRLRAAGFDCVPLPFGPDDARVSNLWAVHRGARPGPTVGLAGHTDVVPPGPVSAWTTPPFVPSHRDGHLYERKTTRSVPHPAFPPTKITTTHAEESNRP